MKPYIDYEYAKNIYENGFTSGFYNYYEVIAVAKWLKQIEKLSKGMMKKVIRFAVRQCAREGRFK